jgi:hypothetical protein
MSKSRMFTLYLEESLHYPRHCIACQEFVQLHFKDSNADDCRDDLRFDSRDDLRLGGDQ